jgi:hypothetical protein
MLWPMDNRISYRPLEHIALCGSSIPSLRSEPQTTGVNATACRAQEKEEQIWLQRVRKLLLVKIEIASRSLVVVGPSWADLYAESTNRKCNGTLIRDESPKDKGLCSARWNECCRSGKRTCRLARLNSAGICSGRSQCRHRLLLTADETWKKVFG